MEYLDNGDLAQKIKQHKENKDLFSQDEVLSIMN